MRRLAPRLLTLLALMRVVPSSDGRAAVCAVGLAAGMGGDDTHSRDSSIPVSTHLRIRCVRGTAGARLTHLSSMVRTRGRRIHSQRICALSTTGTAAVSNLHTALHARLLDSCSCASLTIGRSLLHCMSPATRVRGRGSTVSNGKFLHSLVHSKQQKHEATNTISNRVFNAE